MKERRALIGESETRDGVNLTSDKKGHPRDRPVDCANPHRANAICLLLDVRDTTMEIFTWH